MSQETGKTTAIEEEGNDGKEIDPMNEMPRRNVDPKKRRNQVEIQEKKETGQQVRRRSQQMDNNKASQPVRKDSFPRTRRRTITETSQVTDDCLDEEGPQRARAMSLYGMNMSLRALKITRRLSITSFPRHSDVIPQGRTVAYENTYVMEVKDGEKFKPGATQRIMIQILQSTLDGVEYNANECGTICCALSSLIKSRLRQINMPRHRLVCHVTIGEKLGQQVMSVSRCLWDTGCDNSATATYENTSLFAIANVYAIYYE